ncbi:AAA family ATPase [Desulfonatronum parangueonense]
MKINRLELAAYGHFTNLCLDFTSRDPGLHVVYGPNEAGKSTALRAIRALLYGIESRTSDNFQHKYDKLRIGGELQNRDGRILSFWRRKRNVGDLLDRNEQVMDQRILDAFLNGIEEPLFNSLFGIDHETLISGGKAILEQQGDVGQALFSAGVGLASLHGIIARLEQEEADLFKPSGRNPQLNQAIKRHTDLKAEIRNLCLAGSEWKKRRQVLDELSRQLEETEQINQHMRTELERLERLQRALPCMGKRDSLRQTFAALADVATLSEDFATRVLQAMEDHTAAAKSLQEARSRRERLELRTAGTQIRQDILDQAESIDSLHKQLGMVHQARRDRTALHADQLRLRTEAETLLTQSAPALDLNHRDEIKNLLAQRQTIHSLCNRFAVLTEAETQARRQFQEATTAFENVQGALSQLPEAPDLEGLATAVNMAQKAGDLDSQIRKLDKDALLLKENAAAVITRIGLWKGEPEAIANRPLPAAESIAWFADRFKETADGMKTNLSLRESLQEDLTRIRQDIAIIEQTGQVVTEEDLLQRRRHRDQGWHLIRGVWLEGQDLAEDVMAYAGNMSLPAAFEEGMQAADEAADHLRLAAERVHQYVTKRTEACKLESRLEKLAEEAARTEEEQIRLETQWRELWAPLELEPRTPSEMRGWLEQCQEGCRKFLEARKANAEKTPVLVQRRNLLALLAKELGRLNRRHPDSAEELAPLLEYAEQHLGSLKALREQIVSLRKELARLAQELDRSGKSLEQCSKRIDDWRQIWKEALTSFGLPFETTPDAAVGVLEALSTCLEKINQADQCRGRIDDIDACIQHFEAAAAALTGSIAAPELDGLTMDQAVVKLQSLLTQAGSQKTIRDKLLADLEGLEEEIRHFQVTMEMTENQLTELRRVAGKETNEGLRETRQRYEQWLAVRSELTRQEEVLMEIAQGVPLDELDRQRAEVDPDTLPGRIDALRSQIANELEPRIRALSEQKGEARSELQRMDGSDAAAAKETEIQGALSLIRRLADRYTRVRLAALLLKQEVEQYRRRHQGPILAIASRYFAALTLGSFSGLRSDINDKGHPVLVGVSSNGSMKNISEMSFGTRDQLYLALRLATLEWRLESHEPMPLIADDILINFDDHRTTATLRALADLGRKNQVILFTHHGWVVDAAINLDIPDEAHGHIRELVKIHHLGPMAVRENEPVD